MMASPMKENHTYVVGIGASAGGLEAITQLIVHLKSDVPCAYVILQHLSPNHRSMMAEILSRETPLKVKEAQQGDAPEAGAIYVVPSNCNALFRSGRLHLIAAPPEVVPKPSINQFLISLAAEEGEASIGIILSGTGSDGVAGLRAIQAAGGFTFVQKPDTAKYDGMPRAAIDAGVVDYVLSPEEIALRLPKLLELQPRDSDEGLPAAGLLDQLLNRLRDKLGVDFSGYKMGTLMRRIRRREIATNHLDLAAYLAWVDTNPQELDLLARDILISVTAFFRDRDAFLALRGAVQDICNRKAPNSEIRVWVAGCASGEEAYSIAMLFAEVLGDRLTHYRLQIFATDIDDDALNVARRGVYPAPSMSEVPPELLENYFHPVKQAFEASKLLRDMIVFARHNLVGDPPFLRLDLVSCRNVLIYFDAPLQSRVLQTFHFGLAKEGYLFLGHSESVAHAEQSFTALDRRERLFHKKGEQALLAPNGRFTGNLSTPAQRRERKADCLLAGLIEHFKLTAALCDLDGNIQHTAGSVDHYLQFPVGTARLHVAEVAVPSLRGELLTLLHRHNKTVKPQRGRRRKLGREWVRLYLSRVGDAGGQWLLVLFIPESAGPVEAEPIDTAPSRQLEDELRSTREHLQTLVEEMATANEEMQALNEEAQASNEELQATNEEMEAANEELQATNEELLSLNQELNVKSQELFRLSEEYSHLYDALEFPILVFDRACQLIRFNAPAARRFDFRSTALHLPVARLRLPEAMEDLETRLQHVLAHLDREEVLITQNDRILRMAITPGIDKVGEVARLVVTLIDVTDVAQIQAALEESRERLAALMENTTLIFAMRDLRGAYLFANRSFLEFFALDKDRYSGQNDFTLLPPTLAADLWGLDLQALRTRAPVAGEHLVERDGVRRYLRTVHQVLIDGAGQPSAFITEGEDITDRRYAEEQLRITARVFHQAGEAIVVTDPTTRIQTTNPAFSSITGYGPQEVAGKNLEDFLQSTRQGPEQSRLMWQSLKDSGFWQGELWNTRKGGEAYPQWMTVNRIDGAQGDTEHYVAVFSDISSIKNSQHRMEYLATHDALTNLPNRSLFQDRLRQALAQARRQNQRVVVVFIDLDNFKTINDTLGHDVGDELLRQAGDRLKNSVRSEDTVARLGGDEFTAILVDCPVEIVNQLVERIVDELSCSFEIQDRSLFVSASVGVAIYPQDGTDSTSLTKAADAAMYRAKEMGRNRVEYFVPDLHVRLLKRTAMVSALREALRLPGRLRMVYQPKFALAPHHPLAGAEALLRWQDPELGTISPGEFIPIAEQVGLILDLERQVAVLLLEQLASWRRQGFAVPCIAFNTSPRSIREPGFATGLLEMFREYGVPPEATQIEITEGALLEHSGPVTVNLDTLDQAGIKLAIDDFGTGFSSLAYLKRLPLCEVKLDRTFVSGLGVNKGDEAIARAVISLAHALEFRTVAEGVETQEQLSWLTEQGCDMAQGYYLARPLEADAFQALMESSQSGE